MILRQLPEAICSHAPGRSMQGISQKAVLFKSQEGYQRLPEPPGGHLRVTTGASEVLTVAALVLFSDWANSLSHGISK